MAKKNPEILVGDLLVKAGVIERSDLADALPISLKTALPVGRILISNGSLKEQTLQAALFAQSLVRDCLLSEDIAAQALNLLHTKQITLEEALAKLGWRSEAYELTNRLGQLFLDAEIITEQELASGLEGFYTAGLPLARVLVIQGVINNNIAFSALTAQKLVRDGLISREQAIDALRSAAANETTIEESLSIHGYLQLYPQNTIRLGELLVLAGLTTEAELLENVERSLNYEEYIGETFVHTGKLPKDLLECALELQKLSTKNLIEPREAAEALRRIVATNMTVDEAVHEIKASPEVRAKLLGLMTCDQLIGKDKAQGSKTTAAAGEQKKSSSAEKKSVAPEKRKSSPEQKKFVLPLTKKDASTASASSKSGSEHDELLGSDAGESSHSKQLRDAAAEPYLALLRDAILKDAIAASPQVRQQLLGLFGCSDKGDEEELEAASLNAAVSELNLDFLRAHDDNADGSEDQAEEEEDQAYADDDGTAAEATYNIDQYLTALQQSVRKEIKNRKKKLSQRSLQKGKRRRLNEADSALLAMAELQSSLPPKEPSGAAKHQVRLINKLIRRVEELSYRTGFLEGCIATSNGEADLIEDHLAKHGWETVSEHPDNGAAKTSGGDDPASSMRATNNALYRKHMMLSAESTRRTDTRDQKR